MTACRRAHTRRQPSVHEIRVVFIKELGAFGEMGDILLATEYRLYSASPEKDLRIGGGFKRGRPDSQTSPEIAEQSR